MIPTSLILAGGWGCNRTKTVGITVEFLELLGLNALKRETTQMRIDRVE